MLKVRFLAIVLSISTLLSCQQSEISSEKNYFDVDAIVRKQIEVLSKQKPSCSKTVVINGEPETIQTNTLSWEKEMELFLQGDINKKAFRMSYDSLRASNMLLYKLKKDQQAPVKELIILYDKSKKPSHVIIKSATDNLLYNSEKILTMKFSGDKLISYSVKAWQQLFIGNKKNVLIETKIL